MFLWRLGRKIQKKFLKIFPKSACHSSYAVNAVRYPNSDKTMDTKSANSKGGKACWQVANRLSFFMGLWANSSSFHIWILNFTLSAHSFWGYFCKRQARWRI